MLAFQRIVWLKNRFINNEDIGENAMLLRFVPRAALHKKSPGHRIFCRKIWVFDFKSPSPPNGGSYDLEIKGVVLMYISCITPESINLPKAYLEQEGAAMSEDYMGMVGRGFRPVPGAMVDLYGRHFKKLTQGTMLKTCVKFQS